MKNKEHYLKKKIKNRGLKFIFISNIINKKPQELSMWLNGKREMPIEIETIIKSYLGISP